MPEGPAPRLDRRAALAGVGIVVVVVAAYMLAARRSYSFDESVSVGRFISSGSPRSAFTEQVVFNNHPLFSAGQALLWRAGGTTEAWQRIPPAVYGAAAAGVLFWAVGRRLGVLAGAVAAAVVAANPSFAEQARSVRGYSLAALAVVVAGVAVVEYIDCGSRWWLPVHGGSAAVAVGTHLYAGVALAGVGVAVLVWYAARRRRPDLWLIGTWVLAALAALAVYLPTLGYLRSISAERGSVYRPGFGREAARAVLGEHGLAITALVVLCVIGLVALALRPARLAGLAAGLGGAVAIVVILGIIWLILQPRDLYPRFLVMVVPAVALAVALAVARWPVLAAVAALAVGAMALANSRVWFDEVPNRQAASLLMAARDQGLRPCVLGGGGLVAYEREVPEVTEPDALANCDVFVPVGTWGTYLSRAARDEFEHQWRIEGRYRAFSRVPPAQLAGP